MTKEIIENLIETDGFLGERIDIVSRRIDILNDVNQMRKNTIDALIQRIEKLEQRIKDLENGW